VSSAGKKGKRKKKGTKGKTRRKSKKVKSKRGKKSRARVSYRDSHSFEFMELQQKVLGGQEEDITTISRVFSALTSRLRIEAEKKRKLRRRMHRISKQFETAERRCRARLKHSLRPISGSQVSWGMDQADVLYACRLWELLEEKEAVECIDFSKLSRCIIRQEIQPMLKSMLKSTFLS
jgi:hypothetical protein